MGVTKIAKDHLLRLLWGTDSAPAGLAELQQYFRMYGPIEFASHQEDGVLIAVSTNFRYGSIIAHGSTSAELDRDIRDAILTSFEVPSSYAKEASITKAGEAPKPAYAVVA